MTLIVSALFLLAAYLIASFVLKKVM